MRATIVGVLALLMLTTFCSYAQTADTPPPQFPGPYPVDLKVGDIFIVSKSIEIVSPVRNPICDDLKVVNVVDTPDGLAFKGISPGKTLCSVASGAAMSGSTGSRRVFVITVHE